MRWSRLQRRPFAVVTVALIASGTVLLTSGAAHAAPTNAGSFEVAIAARLEIGAARAGVTLAGTLTGAVDGSGHWESSAGTLSSVTDPIDRARDTLLMPPIDEVLLTAPAGFTGSVDPDGHTIELHATGAQFVFLGTGAGMDFECASEPSELHVRATDYDAAAGTAIFVADSTFQVPAIAAGVPECLGLDNYLNSIHALPTAPDQAGIVFAATFTPPPTAARPPDAAPTPPAPATPTDTTPIGSPVGTAASLASGARVTGNSTRTPDTTARDGSASTSSLGAASTPTTGYAWRGPHQLLNPDWDGGVTPPAVAPRTPQAAARIADGSGNRIGFGIIAVLVGGLVGGVVLLRSELRRVFRRRGRAAF